MGGAGGRREEQVVNLIGMMDGRAVGGATELILGQNTAKISNCGAKGAFGGRGEVVRSCEVRCSGGVVRCSGAVAVIKFSAAGVTNTVV